MLHCGGRNTTFHWRRVTESSSGPVLSSRSSRISRASAGVLCHRSISIHSNTFGRHWNRWEETFCEVAGYRGLDEWIMFTTINWLTRYSHRGDRPDRRISGGLPLVGIPGNSLMREGYLDIPVQWGIRACRVNTIFWFFFFSFCNLKSTTEILRISTWA